jgi:hypothetical protein
MTSDSEPTGQNQPTPNGENEAAKQSNQTENKAAPTSTSNPQLKPRQCRYEITCAAEKNWWDRFKPYFEVVGVFLLAVYTIYTIKMYHANKEAADAATSAAEIAKNTLVDQKTAFEIEQRPYLVLDGPPQFLAPPVAKSEIRADVTLKNIGKTPAFRIVWQDALIKFKPGPNTPAGHNRLRQFLMLHYKELEDKNAAVQKELSTFPAEMHAEQDLAPEATLFTTSQEPVVLSVDEFSSLRAVEGAFALFDIGIADYRDSFGNEYETDFCAMYWGTEPRTWHICDSHNTIR